MCIWLRRDPFSLIHVCILQILMKLFESIVVLSSKCDDDGELQSFFFSFLFFVISKPYLISHNSVKEQFCFSIFRILFYFICGTLCHVGISVYAFFFCGWWFFLMISIYELFVVFFVMFRIYDVCYILYILLMCSHFSFIAGVQGHFFPQFKSFISSRNARVKSRIPLISFWNRGSI